MTIYKAIKVLNYENVFKCNQILIQVKIVGYGAIY